MNLFEDLLEEGTGQRPVRQAPSANLFEDLLDEAPARVPQKVAIKPFGLDVGLNVGEDSLLGKTVVGLGRAGKNWYEGAKQFVMENTAPFDAFAGTKYAAADKLAQYTKDVEKERAFYRQTPIGQSTTGKVAEFVGEVAPLFGVPLCAANCGIR